MNSSNKNKNSNSKEVEFELLDFDDIELEGEIENLTLDDVSSEVKIDSKEQLSIKGDTKNSTNASSAQNNNNEDAFEELKEENASSSSKQNQNTIDKNNDVAESNKEDNNYNNVVESNKDDNNNNDDTSSEENLQQKDEKENNQQLNQNKKESEVNKEGQNKPKENKNQNQNSKDSEKGKESNKTNNNKNNDLDQKDKPPKDKQEKKPEDSNKNNKAIDKKRSEAKKKQGNQPKSMKNSGKPGIKNKMKNGIKNGATKLKNNAYDSAREKVTDNQISRSVKAAKDRIDKVKKGFKTTKNVVKNTVKTFKALTLIFTSSTPILIISLLSFFAITMAMIFWPGSSGTDRENYSETDQKTLDKINALFNKYPNADGALAMATVVYPYAQELWSGEVLRIVKDGAEYEDVEAESGDEYAGDDTEDIISDDTVQDDYYLSFFRKWSYRQRLKKVLSHLNNGEQDYENYLKNTYFNGNGYDILFNSVESSQKDTLKNLIISDLKNLKTEFINYVDKSYSCTAILQDAGTVEVENMILSENIYVDVKEESCHNNVDSCNSFHSSPIPLKEYVKGVVNTEISINETTSMEKIKTQMVMSKSVVLGRYKEMGWTLKQEGNNYIIPIRANTDDQDYCDYNVGCSNKESNNQHAPASEKVKEMLEQAWNETTKDFVYYVEGKRTVAYYKDLEEGYNKAKFCEKGACLLSDDFDKYIESGMNYQQILTTAFNQTEDGRHFTLIEVDDDNVATSKVSNGLVCSQQTSSSGVPDDKMVYYNQNDYMDTFCGVEGATIKTHGCGVTSMAMVVATLTDIKTTPVDINNFATGIKGVCGSGGSYFSLFVKAAEKYGLEVKDFTKDLKSTEEIIKYLKEGGLVIANVGPNSPFTTGGHFIVLRRTGGKDIVYVADPAHPELFNTPYNIKDFINKGWITDGWKGFKGPKSEEYAINLGTPGQATGILGSPFDPTDLTTTFESINNAPYFPRYEKGGCHGAVDFNNVYEGQPVYAADGGTVVEVGDYSGNCYDQSICSSGNNGFGIFVTIDHGNGYKTRYAHFSERKVNVGDKVAKGDLIGLAGNTGQSSGPHLHLELIDVNSLNAYGREKAKCNIGMGLMNVTNYINTGISYVGQNK